MSIENNIPSQNCDGGEGVPEVAIRWCLSHSVISNTGLATLSNVNRQWRQVTKQVILEQVVGQDSQESHLPLLLLPSMLRRLIMYTSTTLGQDAEPFTPNAAAPLSPSPNNETFCAAWFDPSGIRPLPVALSGCSEENDNDYDDADENDYLDRTITVDDSGDWFRSNNHPYHHNHPIEPFAPSGGPSYVASEHDNEDGKRGGGGGGPSLTASNTPVASSTEGEHNVVICADEWQGYRSPMDVLGPFGYTNSFVMGLLQSCHAAIHSPLDWLPLVAHAHCTTFAVRGATVARPEGYCLCYDDDSMATVTKQLETSQGVVRHNNKSDESTTEPYYENSRLVDIRWQEYKHVLLRRKRRRQEMQRQVLPRVIINHRTAKQKTTDPDGHDEVVSPRIPARSLQFLNADGGHAVCMMTPLFECGPLIEPVTIFCVGIATEDGCFVSGLRHRFELGHLYPSNQLPESLQIQLSPICMAVNPVEQEQIYEENDIKILQELEKSDSMLQNFADQRDDSSGDDDSDHNTSMDMKCNCMFKGIANKFDSINDSGHHHRSHDDSSDDQSRDSHNRSDNDMPPHRIHRGRIGPGQWHVYTAIVDGTSTRIRVDGIEESIQSEMLETRSYVFKALLDGLTIGSDHDFGMTLCSGYGSGGEGQGAMAELAVFQGRLEDADLQTLERHFMQQHGIPPVTVPPEEIWQEHEWRRQAHSFFVAPQPMLPHMAFATMPALSELQAQQQQQQKLTGGVDNNGDADHANDASPHTAGLVPLRFLTRHRSVAWQIQSAVTGEVFHPNKIGCRPGAESSDW